jgi:hypothetical protein
METLPPLSSSQPLPALPSANEALFSSRGSWRANKYLRTAHGKTTSASPVQARQSWTWCSCTASAAGLLPHGGACALAAARRRSPAAPTSRTSSAGPRSGSRPSCRPRGCCLCSTPRPRPAGRCGAQLVHCRTRLKLPRVVLQQRLIQSLCLCWGCGVWCMSGLPKPLPVQGAV